MNRQGTIEYMAGGSHRLIIGHIALWLAMTASVAWGLVVPDNGPFAGGNTVTITNENFGTITNVLVGLVAAAIHGSGTNWVTITVPFVGSAGAKDIVVQTSDNGETVLAGAYTVNPAGWIRGGFLPGGPYIDSGRYISMGLKSDGTVMA